MKVLECLRIDPGRYLAGESRRGIRSPREAVVAGIYLSEKRYIHLSFCGIYFE